ncbi:hypothetical protein [Halorubrum sp. N11]|uniref:hypothetical protein n=1 Tax=Halorubrum sp. N11 TaxID=3402276 RepID=UPI003EC0D340
MNLQGSLRRGLIGCILLILIVGTSGVVVAHPVSSSPGADTISSEDLEGASDHLGQQVISPDTVQIEQVEVEDEEGEIEDGEEEEGGGSVIGDWWGLGEEAQESAYMGLVELGVVILTIGLGGYMLAKRTSVVPTQYRRYLLPAHEWSMLLGTALTVPHFFGVEEWEGLGFAVGVLLAIEVISGLYGYYLHRHVIRLGRGGESPAILRNVLTLSKKVVFSRWLWIHRSLTVVTAVVLVLHIVTAIGE